MWGETIDGKVYLIFKVEVAAVVDVVRAINMRDSTDVGCPTYGISEEAEDMKHESLVMTLLVVVIFCTACLSLLLNYATEVCATSYSAVKYACDMSSYLGYRFDT